MNAEALTSVAAGVGLAAACGLRVFGPLTVLGVAARLGIVHLSTGFDWVATTPALIALGVATLLEVGAYSVPWLDHALDSIATPAAVLAGVVVSGAVLGDLDPYLKWSLAAVAGGGLAAAVQSLTVVGRGAATLGTGGLVNPLFAAAETVGAILLASLSLLLPLVAVTLLAAAVLWGLRRLRRRQRVAGQRMRRGP